MAEPKGVPIAEYARPIYTAWDARSFAPPKNFRSWMAFWEHLYGGMEVEMSEDRSNDIRDLVVRNIANDICFCCDPYDLLLGTETNIDYDLKQRPGEILMTTGGARIDRQHDVYLIRVVVEKLPSS